MYITNLAYVETVSVSGYLSIFLSRLGRILASTTYNKLNIILVPFPSSGFIYCENISDFPELVDLRGRENEDMLSILRCYLEVHNLSVPT